MSAEIVNLRQARKARARTDREKEAEANRAKFGRTKAERRQSDAETKLADKRLDALKRTPQGTDEDGSATT
jgi:uncharacterized protein DUF4169